jgi:hypothetical protein
MSGSKSNIHAITGDKTGTDFQPPASLLASTQKKRETRMKIVNDIVNRYWAATTILLAGVVSGCNYCLPAVIALNIIQVIHFIYREKSLTAFPVQVRMSYLGLLLLAQVPYLFWIFWRQLIGTAAMVLFQYCFLARCMSLMPWNKDEPYSVALVKRTFFSAPVSGNILQGLPAEPAA